MPPHHRLLERNFPEARAKLRVECAQVLFLWRSRMDYIRFAPGELISRIRPVPSATELYYTAIEYVDNGKTAITLRSIPYENGDSNIYFCNIRFVIDPFYLRAIEAASLYPNERVFHLGAIAGREEMYSFPLVCSEMYITLFRNNAYDREDEVVLKTGHPYPVKMEDAFGIEMRIILKTKKYLNGFLINEEGTLPEGEFEKVCVRTNETFQRFHRTHDNVSWIAKNIEPAVYYRTRRELNLISLRNV